MFQRGVIQNKMIVWIYEYIYHESTNNDTPPPPPCDRTLFGYVQIGV